MDKSVYLNDWAEGGQQEMLSDFGIGPEDIEGAEIIVASYTYENYSGDAYVLFRRDGKLWEVHAGHCSCYGLSESDFSGDCTTQWQPEETTQEAILHRLERGTWGEEGRVKNFVLSALGAET